MIYGIGSDILAISRITACIKRHPQRFAEKILSPAEINTYQSKHTLKNQANYLAKRWAAKEAFAKACGTGLRDPVLFPHISLVNDILGKPSITTEPVLTQWLAKRKITNTHLSLSDENNTIIAFVVLERSDNS